MKTLLIACLGLGALGAHAGPMPRTGELTVELTCQVVYLPARSTWVRRLALRGMGPDLQEVHIDGVRVHSFSVLGSVLLTALDNERIQLHLEDLRWSSDFRGLSQGQGQCETETQTQSEWQEVAR